MSLQLSRPIVFFDIESTGTNIATDKIVEIYLKKVNPDQTEEILHHYINPGKPIPEEATAVHHITNEFVEDKPLFKQVAGEIWDFIQGCDLGGYNIRKFDIPLLGQELFLCQCNLDLTNIHIVDSYDIVVKELPRTLQAIFKHYTGYGFEDAHTAGADVDACITILHAQVDVHESLDGKTVEEIAAYCEGEKKMADHAGKIYLKDGEYYFNFGKHMDKLVKNESNYVDWMLTSNDFTMNTKNLVRKIISNGR